MNVFKVENVSYAVNGLSVLKNIAFNICYGDFFGIAGPNGAGKSTLLKILSGFLKLRQGKVYLFDKSLENYRHSDIAKIIAVLPTEVYIPYNFTVREIILMGRSPHIKWWKDYSKKDELVMEKILCELKLEKFAFRSFNSLSSGERQTVLIAQALCQEPKIMLLDEPTSHLDIKHQIEIFSLIDKLCKEKKLTIVVVSHDINLLSRYCFRMLMLKKGSIKAYGSINEVVTRENIMAVYGANSSIVQVTPHGRPHVYITGA